MTRVQAIKKEICGLSPAESAELRDWILELPLPVARVFSLDEVDLQTYQVLLGSSATFDPGGGYRLTEEEEKLFECPIDQSWVEKVLRFGETGVNPRRHLHITTRRLIVIKYVGMGGYDVHNIPWASIDSIRRSRSSFTIAIHNAGSLDFNAHAHHGTVASLLPRYVQAAG